MDTTFPENGTLYRSIRRTQVHHAGYMTMIAMQIRTAALRWLGGLKLMRARHDGDATFLSARGWAISGLTLGFLTWQVIFMMIGGEWFGMWMSSNGTASKPLFCFFVTFLLVLIYLVMADDENGRPATPHRRSSEPGLNAAAVDQPSRPVRAANRRRDDGSGAGNDTQAKHVMARTVYGLLPEHRP
ncbi:DUF2165 family protein [Paraburkholderia sp. BR13439]|uniref:DUF2165 family protein n=1 Tax=unclassified Paraburkholderia TaxID=2615204 RepID=UPI0034CE8576